MTRTRRMTGRGTRFTSGAITGTSGGLFVENIATTPKLITSGVSNWAGSTVTLTTGLNNIEQIICSVINDGDTTHALAVKLRNVNSPTPGSASALLFYSTGPGGATMPSLTQAGGCSIAFIAMGT